MYAASLQHHSSMAAEPAPSRLKSCLDKSAAKKMHRVRFALPDEASGDPSKLLGPPPRVLDSSCHAKGGPRQQLAGCINPAVKHMWVAFGLVGAYHTALQPSSARVAIMGICFVLPASRTLLNHGVKKSIAKLLPHEPLKYFVATAAAGAGVYVGLVSSNSPKK